MPTSAVLTWLAPYLKELAAGGLMYLGGRAVGGLLGSPEQQRYQQQLAMVNRLTPDYVSLLQRQMKGQPTVATEAIRRQVQQEGRGAQQALATSAARMGQGGTEVARAQQARLAAAETQQLMQELGRAQLEAMSQAGALTGGARREQALLAQQEASDIQEIARFMMMRLGDMETRQLMNDILRSMYRERIGANIGFRPADIAEFGREIATPINPWEGVIRPKLTPRPLITPESKWKPLPD